MMRNWSFSLLLGALYLASFHLWMAAGPGWVVPSSIAVTALSVWLFVQAVRRGYFLNRCDGFLHFMVILDLLLEGTILRPHQGHGFYLCALGFAVVIGGY